MWAPSIIHNANHFMEIHYLVKKNICVSANHTYQMQVNIKKILKSFSYRSTYPFFFLKNVRGSTDMLFRSFNQWYLQKRLCQWCHTHHARERFELNKNYVVCVCVCVFKYSIWSRHKEVVNFLGNIMAI